MDNTIVVNNSLMGGSTRGDQADIGRVYSIAGILPSTDKGDPIAGIVNPQSKEMANSNVRSGAKPSIDQNSNEQAQLVSEHDPDCDKRATLNIGIGGK